MWFKSIFADVEGPQTMSCSSNSLEMRQDVRFKYDGAVFEYDVSLLEYRVPVVEHDAPVLEKDIPMLEYDSST